MHKPRLKLVEEKMGFTFKIAPKRYDQLQEDLFRMRLEKDTLHLLNDELNNKVTEMRKAHESSMAQHSEEKRLAGERIPWLETEVKNLVTKERGQIACC